MNYIHFSIEEREKIQDLLPQQFLNFLTFFNTKMYVIHGTLRLTECCTYLLNSWNYALRAIPYARNYRLLMLLLLISLEKSLFPRHVLVSLSSFFGLVF